MNYQYLYTCMTLQPACSRSATSARRARANWNACVLRVTSLRGKLQFCNVRESECHQRNSHTEIKHSHTCTVPMCTHQNCDGPCEHPLDRLAGHALCTLLAQHQTTNLRISHVCQAITCTHARNRQTVIINGNAMIIP